MLRFYDKQSLNIDQQIEHLRANGMHIADEAMARFWLTHVSYYRLSAYWLYFEHPKDHTGPRFREGTSFEQVTALYDFDRLLRRLVMRGTEHVEVALRGNWAYQLAMLGDGHSYLDARHYSARKQFHDNLAKLAKEVGDSNETYIEHYRRTYWGPALPPVWMVAEMMTFGQLSRWYSSLKDDRLRNRIATPLGLNEATLVPFVRHLVDVRNTCAHHGRLWNRGFLICPKLPSKPRDLQMSLDHSVGSPPAKLYNTLTILAHVVGTVAPDSSWAREIKAYILAHPTVDLAAMGFPADWADKPLWAGI
jgi:abortive infection bacteriophage resistance protein